MNDGSDREGAGRLPILRMALWLGAIAGMLEVLIEIVRSEAVQHGVFRKGLHVLWTIPVSTLTLIGLTGGLLALLARFRPRASTLLGGFFVCTLAFWSVLAAVPGLRARYTLLLSAGIAAWLAPWLAAHALAFRRVVAWTLPVVLMLPLALLATDFGNRALALRRASASRPPAPRGAKNVLLIVMDTVRADATSLYGAARPTTPSLEALARRGARFERAIATAPWTLPSHASMFTGRWPWELSVGADRPLDGNSYTLAEYLASQGYATGGFAGNPVFCTPTYGLTQGFGHYEDLVITPLEVLRSSALGARTFDWIGRLTDEVYRRLGRPPRHRLELPYFRKDGARINRDALRWITTPRDRPFFAFLNYFDAHDPYLVPKGFDRHFGRHPQTLADYRLLRKWEEKDKTNVSSDEIALLRDSYDDCLAYLDGQIGKLIADLDRRGVMKDTILIITADHGEHFGEHNLAEQTVYGHRASLYQPEIRVPLLIVAPGETPPGSVIRQAVSLRDLPATIVELLGFENRSPFPGASLAGLWRGTRASAEPVLAEYVDETNNPLPPSLRFVGSPRGVMRAVVRDDMSYIRLDDGREELYDLAQDGGEARNIAVDTAAAQAQLETFRGTLANLLPEGFLEPPAAAPEAAITATASSADSR